MQPRAADGEECVRGCVGVCVFMCVCVSSQITAGIHFLFGGLLLCILLFFLFNLYSDLTNY